MSWGPVFRCATHDVPASLSEPSWSQKLKRGECPMCEGLLLRPKLVAKPLEVDTDLHGAGYCECCGGISSRRLKRPSDRVW